MQLVEEYLVYLDDLTMLRSSYTRKIAFFERLLKDLGIDDNGASSGNTSHDERSNIGRVYWAMRTIVDDKATADSMFEDANNSLSAVCADEILVWELCSGHDC